MVMSFLLRESGGMDTDRERSRNEKGLRSGPQPQGSRVVTGGQFRTIAPGCPAARRGPPGRANTHHPRSNSGKEVPGEGWPAFTLLRRSWPGSWRLGGAPKPSAPGTAPGSRAPVRPSRLSPGRGQPVPGGTAGPERRQPGRGLGGEPPGEHGSVLETPFVWRCYHQAPESFPARQIAENYTGDQQVRLDLPPAGCPPAGQVPARQMLGHHTLVPPGGHLLEELPPRPDDPFGERQARLLQSPSSSSSRARRSRRGWSKSGWPCHWTKSNRT